MRLLDRALALLLALALAAAGVVLIIEVIAVALGAGPVVVPWHSWEHWADTTQWNRAVVKVWAVVLIVAGLLVLGLQLVPRRATRVAMQGTDEHTDAAMTRKGLAGAVRAAVLDVDGVAKAETLVTRRSVKVTATASAHDDDIAQQLGDPIRTAAQAQLESLQLRHPLRVRASVKGAKA